MGNPVINKPAVHASYGEAFACFAGGLDAHDHAARSAAFDEFVQFGLPDNKIERWHYTNLSTLPARAVQLRSEEHTSELQSLMRISYAVFCLQKKNIPNL